MEEEDCKYDIFTKDGNFITTIDAPNGMKKNRKGLLWNNTFFKVDGKYVPIELRRR